MQQTFDLFFREEDMKNGLFSVVRRILCVSIPLFEHLTLQFNLYLNRQDRQTESHHMVKFSCSDSIFWKSFANIFWNLRFSFNILLQVLAPWSKCKSTKNKWFALGSEKNTIFYFSMFWLQITNFLMGVHAKNLENQTCFGVSKVFVTLNCSVLAPSCSTFSNFV